MKRISLLLCWIMLLCIGAKAENYPYRSDVLWVTVPNHADWLYKTGEKATVDIQLYQYGIPQDGVTISYELGDDLMPADAKGEVKPYSPKELKYLPNGTALLLPDCGHMMNMEQPETFNRAVLQFLDGIK